MEEDLKIVFFPYFAQGHMLPMIDIAKLFASRGVHVTILTTPANTPLILPTINRFNSSSIIPILLHLIPFPSAAVGLPDGCEHLSSITTDPSQIIKFSKAISLLRNPFDQVLKQLRFDCVVSDFFLPWTYEVAAENGIPRIVFEGSNFFAACALDSVERHKPLESLRLKEESFVIPDLPHQIKLLRSQLQDQSKVPSFMIPVFEVFKHGKIAGLKSFGMVMNSFYELEPDYVEHYRKVLGRKAWNVGPVVLCNQEEVDKSGRGGGGNRGEECLRWLDGRSPGSVLYMCFGSMCNFSAEQLKEMALGLEDSGHPFVWVVRETGDEWIPEGYEERIEGRGVLIKEWAPQLLILNHEAVGGFVTHCGWNSSLEGITAGLSMGTWPLYAEQFFNERFLVDVLKIGVEVGSKVFGILPEDRPVVKAGALEEVVRRLMGDGEEADERRRRARELKEIARKAVEVGGSSYNDLGKLIQELKEKKKKGQTD